MKICTPNAIKELLKNAPKGTAFVNINALTKVKLTGGKKNPDQGRIEKLKVGQPIKCFTSIKGYENAMQRATNDPTFKVTSPGWAERVDNTCILKHKSKDSFYLDAQLNGKARETIYLRDGEPCNPDTIEGLPKRRAGIPLVTRYGLESLRRVSYNKTVLEY
ncbi:MAG: hypothetical protein GY799_21075 [Desulfobulbaceae bacterium]|nr:hypothetical protein [Desulfobulbaceae bacterium]